MAKRIELLVAVKAYPVLSKRFGEVACVAGIRTDTDQPEWIRIFPVPFRDLELSKKFKKYDVISLKATRPTDDTRPESYRPDVGSLEVLRNLPTTGGWKKRWPYVEPLLVESMCQIQRIQAKDKTSLGAFRPSDVSDVEIIPGVEEWDEKKNAILAQPSLFNPYKRELEKIPFTFRYVYRCSDAKCKGHAQSIIDWEISEAFRDWRAKYGRDGALEQIRHKWLEQLCAPSKDTIFFVGNQHLRPEQFLVLGVFWPPKN